MSDETMVDLYRQAISRVPVDPYDLYREVRLEAIAHPNRVDPLSGTGKCQYVQGSDEGPVKGCIFGHAFNDLGVPLESLVLVDDSPDGSIHTLIRNVYNDRDYKPVFVDWCSKVQNNQDGGDTWSEAVNKATQNVHYNARNIGHLNGYVQFEAFIKRFDEDVEAWLNAEANWRSEQLNSWNGSHGELPEDDPWGPAPKPEFEKDLPEIL